MLVVVQVVSEGGRGGREDWKRLGFLQALCYGVAHLCRTGCPCVWKEIEKIIITNMIDSHPTPTMPHP